MWYVRYSHGAFVFLRPTGARNIVPLSALPAFRDSVAAPIAESLPHLCDRARRIPGSVVAFDPSLPPRKRAA